MSDELEQEVMEDADIEVTDTPEDEDLLEFKASMGDPSEVPDPKNKKTTEKKKGKGDAPMKLDTKAGMMNAVMKELASMKKEDVEAAYNAFFAEEDESEEDEIVEDVTTRKLEKLTAADIDVSQDIEAIFNGSDLDEDFKAKVTTIFETAVLGKINEQIEKIAFEAEADVETTISEEVEALAEKVESYLDYVVAEWVEENRLVIEQGVRADMVEDFMKGMRDLFVEHHVDIPEEKIDVVEELIARQEELEAKLSATIDENVQLMGMVKDFEKETIFAESTESLTAVQVDKLRSLAEGIEYSDGEDFADKITMLKKQYFDIDEGTASLVLNDDDSDLVSLAEETKAPMGAMAGYLNAISRSAKK